MENAETIQGLAQIEDMDSEWEAWLQ